MQTGEKIGFSAKICRNLIEKRGLPAGKPSFYHIVAETMENMGHFSKSGPRFAVK
jgi:hypothetical protein